jgi:hypothetical protein
MESRQNGATEPSEKTLPGAQISGEWSKDIQASRPGKRRGVLRLTLHPIQRDAGRQRASMGRDLSPGISSKNG